MKRLILLAVVLPLLLAPLMAGVRVYSQSRPEDSSAILRGYGGCDGSLCFLGIRLGITTLDEARKAVRAHYPTALVDGSIILITSGNDRIHITEHPNGTVNEIAFHYENAKPPLSTLITKFGVPCFIGIYLTSCTGGNCPVEYIELHYDAGFIGLRISAGYASTEIERLNLDLPVDRILLSSKYAAPKTPQACLDLLDEGTNTQLATPWLGFASIRRRYLTYAETRK